jgi:hypothetical protein
MRNRQKESGCLAAPVDDLVLRTPSFGAAVCAVIERVAVVPSFPMVAKVGARQQGALVLPEVTCFTQQTLDQHRSPFAKIHLTLLS